MSRDAQQVARLLQALLSSTRGKLPVGWVAALLVLAACYLFFVEPRLNSSRDAGPRATAGDGSTGAEGRGIPHRDDVVPNAGGEPPRTPAQRIAGASPPVAATGRGAEAAGPPAESRSKSLPPREAPSGKVTKPSEYLTEIGSQTYESPAGLVYGRGSVHGHRLKHLMAHTLDEPHRPGPHGVFDSQEAVEVLTLIDEGYRKAKSGRDTKAEREGPRTVYTVNLRRRIGYVGGESGARRGKPSATHLRLIVEGDRFVTAYPLRP